MRKDSPVSQATLPDDPPERLVAGDVTVDRAAHLVIARGRPVLLSPHEFQLLELLVAHADHVVTNQEIMSTVWGPAFSGDPSTLAVYVRRLRRKLAHDGADLHLRTVRGFGYIFDTLPVFGRHDPD